MRFGPVEPGESMRIRKTVDTAGVFTYHCAVGPSTDLHIKSGLTGAMIVYPRNRLLPCPRTSERDEVDASDASGGAVYFAWVCM